MIARRTATLITTVAVILAVAGPALAKGAYTVTLTGGGQEVTYTGLGDRNTNTIFSTFVDTVEIYDGMWSEGTRIARPTTDLGAPITARWLFIGPGDDIPITQVLYPFAEDGPVAYIPPGQVFIDDLVEEAWFPIGGDVVDALASVGFDVKAFDPDAVVEAVAPPTTIPAATVPPTTVPMAVTPEELPAEEVPVAAPQAGSGFPWTVAIGLTAGTGIVWSAIMGRRHIRRVA